MIEQSAPHSCHPPSSARTAAASNRSRSTMTATMTSSIPAAAGGVTIRVTRRKAATAAAAARTILVGADTTCQASSIPADVPATTATVPPRCGMSASLAGANNRIRPIKSRLTTLPRIADTGDGAASNRPTERIPATAGPIRTAAPRLMAPPQSSSAQAVVPPVTNVSRRMRGIEAISPPKRRQPALRP